MKTIRTLTEAVEVLLRYSPKDMKGKYQLDRMCELLRCLGNPQDSFRSIHIAGTSGKTSTAYFIRGFLEASDQKTGLTVSPHIVAINERVQIGGEPLPEAVFLNYLNSFLDTIESIDVQPTYFELLIALAYWTFAKEKVDYAVVETGLGGLLDATNTITRQDKICVITSIGLDHTEILGDTLPLIAAQKAGIIQPHNHVLVRKQDEEVMSVFREKAALMSAELEIVSDGDAPSILPEFQRSNWSLARAAYEYVRQRDSLPELSPPQSESVAHQTPPGRGEFYHFNDKIIILDGAHNPQKLEALLHSLSLQGITSAAVLANFVESPDSKLQQSVALVRPFASHWIITEFSAGQDLKSRQSFSVDKVLALADAQTEVIMDPHDALQKLLERPEKFLLITGSLYLVSLLRPLLISLTKK